MYQNQFQQYRPQTNNIMWVQGVEGAKAYQLSPNTNAMLMDSENDGIFYIKTSDNIGMCNLRVFKYEELKDTPTTQQIDTSQFVTRAELNELLEKMKGVEDEQSISTTKSKSKNVITK